MSEIQSQALRTGSQIAVYEINELLGSNQSEIIYRARNKRLDSMVILKEFFPLKYASREEDSQSIRLGSVINEFVFEFGLANFIKHNEKLLEIQHPGAQTALNLLEFNQTAYLVLDEPKGYLLSEYVSNSEPYMEDELKKLLSSLLDTLKEFHSVDIVHGDIHPTNILINEHGKPVLLNFASARQKFARYIENPSAELHAGYASPEQYLTRGDIEASSDLYALGAVLYRCITGADPEDGETRMSELNNNNSDPLNSVIDKYHSGFSGELLVTVDWMLQPENKARPQSVSEVIPAFHKAKSSSNYLTDFFFRIKALFFQTSESVPKTKLFGITTLIVSVLASAILGAAAISWYLEQKETSHTLMATKKHTKQVGTAFGKAVDSESGKMTLNQADRDGPEKNAGIAISNSEEAFKTIQNERKLINEYMVKAEDSLAKLYLTTPVDGNAYFYYSQVLKIDPHHKGAKKGIEKIFNQYVSLINKAINANDKPLARLYLNRIKAVLPEDSLYTKTIDQFDEVLQGVDLRVQ